MFLPDHITLITLIYILSGLLSIYLIRWLIIKRGKLKLMSLIPSPPCHPLFGNFYQIIYNSSKDDDEWTKKGVHMLREWSFTYGKDGLFRFNFSGFGSQCVILTRPETIETVLASHDLVGKPLPYRYIRMFLGSGLATSEVNRWKYNRKLINPTFNFRLLEKFLPIFNKNLNILLKVIETQSKNGQIKDIRELVSMYILDTLCETTMGYSLNCQLARSEPEYLKNVRKGSELAVYILVRPWLWFRPLTSRLALGKQITKIVKDLHSFTNQVIRKRKQEMINKINFTSDKTAIEQLQNENSNGMVKHQLAFLDILLSHQLKYPDTLRDIDIRSEVDTFMFAGHHTSSLSLPFALHMIGSHPDVQRKIHQELDSIFPTKEMELTMESLKQMKYIECVIKENLRLFGPAVLIGRENDKEFQCGKYKIPSGTTILIFVYHVHRLEEFYPEPNKFIPERFDKNNHKYNQKHHPFAYLPFSAGPRNCIGIRYAIIQQKSLIASILRRYKITSLQKTDHIKLAVDFTLTAKSEIGLKFESR